MLFSWDGAEGAPSSGIEAKEDNSDGGGTDCASGDEGTFNAGSGNSSEWGKKRQKTSDGQGRLTKGVTDDISSPLLPSGMSGDGGLIGGVLKEASNGQHHINGLGTVEPLGLDDAWPGLTAELSEVGGSSQLDGGAAANDYMNSLSGEDQLLQSMGCDLFGSLSQPGQDINCGFGSLLAGTGSPEDLEGLDKDVKKRAQKLMERIRASHALREKAASGAPLTAAQQV